MLARIIVWGCTLAMVGAVLADYSSYDETLFTTLLGGVVGFAVGSAIAIVLTRLQRAQK
jgi:hypothetical protein